MAVLTMDVYLLLATPLQDEGFCEDDVRYVCDGMRWHRFVKGDLLMKRGQVTRLYLYLLWL